MTLADDRAHRLGSAHPDSDRPAVTPPAVNVTETDFSLDDRYTRESGTIYLTGIQALVRMVRDRALVDRRQNLRTASYISGYEGSPLAGYDLEIARRRDYLTPVDVMHRPGLNEEIAATSVMGSQMAAQVADLGPDAQGHPRDGIVGYWYGKAPGLDRATDALRHANLIGTHPNGGAVAIVGDDPGAKSSTVPCASEMALADLYVPVLYPADPQDILDFGVHAAVMSRVSGLWTSLKIAAHVADGAATAVVDPHRVLPVYGDLGTSPHVPSGRLLGASLMELEQNQLTIRTPRALTYARLNGLNRIVASSPDDRIGLVAAGKTYLDLRESLRLMGITDDDLARLGIRILKLGMVYPLDTEIVERFISDTATGHLDEVIVIEEKRDFIETMMRDVLYRHPRAPRIVGKANEDGSTLFSRFGELDVDAVCRGLAARLARAHHIDAAQDWLDRKAAIRTRIELPLAVRTPYFCSGCPHNSSTKVADNTLVGAGIGCHAMVLLMDPRQVGDVAGITQMGGEGAQWLGMAPFVTAGHFVQNVGDGTFMHSGSLALRAAVASGENITYKLLYNGTVAMTGGQDAVGAMDLGRLVALLKAEGVARIVITSDDAARTRAVAGRGVEVRARDDMLSVQTELAAVPGVTVLIHDQHCAAEKRRKRKRGTMSTPDKRVMINERICEGCGDCGTKSNCLSVHPVDTEFGRKTRIDQSSCNLDFSCLAGDCPSFVTVVPGSPARGHRVADIGAEDIAAPHVPAIDGSFAIRVTGIGGTGVVTVSQVLATAAVLDGHAARTVDMTGLAQKGGAVVADIKLTATPVEQAAKISTGGCDLYLACDSLVGTDPTQLKVTDARRTTAVVSTTQIPTGAMVIDTAVGFPSAATIHDAIDSRVSRSVYLDPGMLATALFGDEQYANMMMIGAACQSGALAISPDAVERAISLNGVAVELNTQAFRRGRQVVADPHAVTEALPGADRAAETPVSTTARAAVATLGALDTELAHTVGRRYDELTAYSSETYARDYLSVIARVQEAGERDLTDVIARNLYKLMAYKDEYEVARLSADPGFAADIAASYGADAQVSIRLHPPMLRALGKKEKTSLGAWSQRPMRALAGMRKLRGTRWDPFGHTEVRRTERALVVEYRALVDDLLAALADGRVTTAQMPTVVALAGLPDMVRGYESVKMGNVERYRTELTRLRGELGI
ncbi:indolepyruvate ferredoxin oxidoreductase family protein [Gordonia sp. ABSL1-1]|uniref:indolepyruvate ferredoxin oxidoreductase family protein n=1 Tax=Gordonia sp. ABSL1-1 TaxID=3053923 RepID=UPI002573F029|nr:indolepyruvate ferredoxin oxidoreductase family protein [Gordonia sp. ABSL1-1]MDL9937963.1 indolepyruvate ferredoxin oxidoreductase family protein [Gordonia sp. ABSL1-1]